MWSGEAAVSSAHLSKLHPQAWPPQMHSPNGGIPEAGWAVPISLMECGVQPLHLYLKIPLCWVGQGGSQLSPPLATRRLSLPFPIIFGNRWERVHS